MEHWRMGVFLFVLFATILIAFEIDLARHRRRDRKKALERQQHQATAGEKLQTELGLLQRMKADLNQLEHLITR